MTENSSRRHHYIPKFLTKGFADQKGMLYIYDKVADKILKNCRAPKSIFYEYERNTIEEKNLEKNSFLEDVFFKRLDDVSAKVIQKFQNNPIENNLFTDENISNLQFFIINLFWRLPLTDYAAKDLVERAVIKVDGKDISDEIRNHPSFIKLNRANFFKETIEQSEIQKDKPKNYNIQISEFEEDLFLISDNPIIFRNYMRQFTDLVESEFKMAISSKRMICYSLNDIPSFKHKMFLKYNATIIEQSKLYVASNDIRVLKGSIEYYKSLKEKNLLYAAKELLFEEE